MNTTFYVSPFSCEILLKAHYIVCATTVAQVHPYSLIWPEGQTERKTPEGEQAFPAFF